MTPDPAFVRQWLPRTGHAFFARFGHRLRPVQRACIPDVLAGRDVLLASPTASGKTEAAAAPLVERLLDRAEGSGPSVVWVSPTRALANDLWRRLEGPCDELEVRVARRTGDHPSSTLAKRPPNLLITTPESLDSLLCRNPALFCATCALVLDELHLLLHSGRGDHLAVLRSRLGRVVGSPVQTLVLSATLEATDVVARRFLDQPVLHEAGGPRPIQVEHLRADVALGRGLTDVVRRLDLRKILTFAGSRARVESLAAELSGVTPFGDAVFVHHGSLERRVRESTEARFLSQPRALCVATSTLEVGIDIGDIDAVLLAPGQDGAPASVASLLQRIGRGNRRTGACRVLVPDDGEGPRLWLEHLLEQAATGELCEDAVPFRPGVLAQQALSLAFQNRGQWVSARALHERLPRDVQATYTTADIEALLQGLVEHEWLAPARRGRHAPAQRALDAFEHGQLHSVIDAGPGSFEVVDELTGKTLGHVAGATSGETMGLAGRRWQVVGEEGRDMIDKRSDRGREVRVRAGRGQRAAGSALFAPRGGRVTSSRRLCQSFAAKLGLDTGTWLLLPASERKGWEVFHFLGTVTGEVLARAVWRTSGKKTSASRALAFHWHGDDPRDLAPPSAASLREATEAGAPGLARRLGAGPLSAAVPSSLAERFALDAIQPAALADRLATCELRTDVPDGLARVLRELRGR